MLRGGILYVKIRKGMDMEDGEDGLPSSARQVLLCLCPLNAGGTPPTFMPAQAGMTVQQPVKPHSCCSVAL